VVLEVDPLADAERGGELAEDAQGALGAAVLADEPMQKCR
jgi:hypothetical protein